MSPTAAMRRAEMTRRTLLALPLGAVLGRPSMPGQAVQAVSPRRLPRWAVIGNDGVHLREERGAGIGGKVVRFSWRRYEPRAGVFDDAYAEEKRAELANLIQAGFVVIADAGLQDTPVWLHGIGHDTYYVNQFGERYRPDGEIDAGDANLIFNLDLRMRAAAYLERLLADHGDALAAVRIGGGRYGELTYPPAAWEATTNAYWAFDGRAMARSPVPDWRPGRASGQGEAATFLAWCLDALTEFQTWQIETVRRGFGGVILVLYPSWGIRTGQIDAAVAVNLDGSTPAERNGEIQRGFDFARQVAAIADPGVAVTTTWLDADGSRDEETDARYWSPVKFLAGLAAAHPLRPALYGENTGWGDAAAMDFSAAQAVRYGLAGMAWFREDQLFAGGYATLDDYRRVIARYGSSATTGASPTR